MWSERVEYDVNSGNFYPRVSSLYQGLSVNLTFAPIVPLCTELVRYPHEQSQSVVSHWRFESMHGI